MTGNCIVKEDALLVGIAVMTGHSEQLTLIFPWRATYAAARQKTGHSVPSVTRICLKCEANWHPGNSLDSVTQLQPSSV